MTLEVHGIEIDHVIEGEGPLVTMSQSLACNLSMGDEPPHELDRVLPRFLDTVTGRNPLRGARP